MNNKKILIVYPHNFLQGLHGTNMNIYQLTKVFKELNYNIDLFAYEGFTPDSDFSNFEDQNKEKLIVDPENDINVSYTDLTNKVYVKINILRTKNYPSYEIGCYRC